MKLFFIVQYYVGRHNGNISEIDWWNEESATKRYSYQYDGLNRLRNGIYNDPGATIPTNINSERMEYDLNGNITRLSRNAKHGKYNTPVLIDSLAYTYENNNTSNRLQRIDDATNNKSGYPGGGQVISYDDNGNMTAMPDKGISDIAYNFLNLPTQIKQNTNTTTYLYRADGVKVKKTYKLVNAAGPKTINTEYLDGFQYSTPNTEPIRRALEEPDDATLSARTAGNEEAFSPLAERAIIVDPGNNQGGITALSFFPTSEGYYDYENFRYIYQYKDHLGNVRVSYLKDESTGDLRVMDTNEFYPFGMSFLKPVGNDSVYDPMAIPYNYKYQGQELQETGFYSFKWRNYMPDVGRWMSIDPLAELSPDLTPFRFAFNNPISFTDPTGMYEDDYDRDEMQDGRDEGPGDKWANKGYDYFFERDRNFGSERDDFMADMGSEYSEEIGRNDINPEEPVSLFGKTDRKWFHQVFNQMHSLFKDTKGDGIFRVYAHGNFGTIFNGEDQIRDAETFDKVMSSKNSNWNNVDKMKEPILILYSCLSGIDTNLNVAMGKQISKAHPNLVVIAFNGFVTYDTKAIGIKNVNRAQDSGDGQGIIVFYQNGKHLKGYKYNQFLQKYPNFK